MKKFNNKKKRRCNNKSQKIKNLKERAIVPQKKINNNKI